MVPAFAATSLDDHEIGFFERSQMLHHGCAIEVRKEFSQRSRRLWSGFERIQHLPTSFTRQRLEDQIVILLI